MEEFARLRYHRDDNEPGQWLADSIARSHSRLPATDHEEDERCASEHGVDS